MAEDIAAPFVPAQYVGEATTTSESRELVHEDAAVAFFKTVVDRMLDANKWYEFAGKGLAVSFQLTDLAGRPVDGPAETGMYMQIDLPGPGPSAGKGYDWVKIEQKEHVTLNEHQEIFFMRARPTEHPVQKSAGIAHFLKKEASSSFVVVRNQRTVTATVYGRNEVPNVDAPHLKDKIRNAVIGSTGAIGISKMQWKALVTGLLEVS
ncbi:hypothetical protein SAMN05660909_01991 [Chitinophaga terrae (ex Kim and Jung 2007)]|uniref:Uncharacterized protein n=1 Tax=Chitinophaga terrae (ex Kim and Jung 2007) TaxID=408074 RepID=A0A1H4BA01_9BACT|nr:hypothetical protein [Chitinophaga terrae (ex Kim and Jung 2007)]MDQ0106269.1 hypothetical protein [Chitinophaga terrae (ex Kim and Jung 2007)]GEP92092.1 hypothetical protein CTE07_37370 [Chitinophaga terrae (ex Kim and Jung 2007)]SEA44926.1 hypothetical protein SAMN05660909_01991 [Chitinophaga terrae (ex Kim and Jung 2007)]